MKTKLIDSPTLDVVLQRLKSSPDPLDAMRRECLALDGARQRAIWLLDHDPDLKREFTVQSLAGLLLHTARTRC